METNEENIRLEFGCGESITPGFIGVDVRNFPHVRYNCDAWKIREFVDDNSIDEIYSRHFLEHLTFYQAELTLNAWYHILKKDGLLRIIVPNMISHIEEWLNPQRDSTFNNGVTDEVRSIAGFWGKQRESENGEIWDFHKSGYDFKLLEKKLLEKNFRNVEHVPDLRKNLHVICVK